ncbi:MAG: hypothetical protein ACM65L_16235 [Microcoleus sp.]
MRLKKTWRIGAIALFSSPPTPADQKPIATQLELSGISQLAWSSDSQQIAFTFNDIKGDKSNLYVINRDGSGVIKLSGNNDLNASSPVWQPQ